MYNLKKNILGSYKAEDVDKLLSKVRIDYEKCLKEQKERILKLREENREMATLIERYKNSEKLIIGAIKALSALQRKRRRSGSPMWRMRRNRSAWQWKRGASACINSDAPAKPSIARSPKPREIMKDRYSRRVPFGRL
jgi:cell division septum initiation protein DivIVA